MTPGQAQWDAALSTWGNHVDALSMIGRGQTSYGEALPLLQVRASRTLEYAAHMARELELDDTQLAWCMGAALCLCVAPVLGPARSHRRAASWLLPHLGDVNWSQSDQWHVTSLLSALWDAHSLVNHGANHAAYVGLARRAPARILNVLAMAEAQGVGGEHVWPELFELEARDAGVWQNDRPLRAFAEHIDHAMSSFPEHVREWVIREGHWALIHGRVHSPEEAISRGWSARSGLSKVWIQCGLSGAGKTTWATSELPQAQMVCMDDLRAEITGNAHDQRANAKVFSVARERFKQALREGREVVWSSTNLRRAQRSALLETARDYGAHTTLVVHHVGVGQALTRNTQRSRRVPSKVILEQAHAFELPLEDEAHRVMWIGSKGECWRDTRSQSWCLGGR
jgi:predicted kinase